MTLELNSEQRAAAECLDRPVLVTAGAGSGKTRMLTQRFVNAVLPDSVPGWRPASVDEVVAITFTDKAAGEIAERVRIALRASNNAEAARNVSNAWISTIHGLCSRLLRRHAFEAGVDPLFSVADTVETGRLREQAFEDSARGLLAEDGGAVALFDAFAYDALFSATVAIVRELAVAGCSATDIELESGESPPKLLSDAQDLFRRGMTTCELGYAGSSKDPWDHVARCEELLGRCSVLVSEEREDDELLSELLVALNAYKPLRKLKGFEDVTKDLTAIKDELIGRTAAALVAPHARALKELVAAYSAAYSASKRAAGVVDFDDLQVKAVELLEQRPEIAARYREQFRMVMVDEFQDTDALQLRLVEALSDGDLCTVGDEKQSIYRFRGADIDVYRAHRTRMEQQGALITELDVNYRSHPDILGFVNSVFGSDEYFGSSLLKLVAPEGNRSERDLDRALADDCRVETLFVDSTGADSSGGRATEAGAIARRVAELCDAGVMPRDVAILLRAYSHAHTYADALSTVGIRAVVVGGSRFFGLPEIAIMRALNRTIANVEDGPALGELLASDFVPITSDALAILRLGSGERDTRPLWTLLCEKGARLAPGDADAAERLITVLDSARQRVGRMPLSDVLLLAVEESGWDLRLLAGGNMGCDAFANVLKFARQAAAFEASAGTGPAAFAQHLDAKERLGDTEAPASLADDGSDAVRIMSIHASKGLEFPIVVVPGLASRGRNDSPIARVCRQEGRVAIAMKTPAGDDGQARTSSAWFTRFSDEAVRADDEESARVLYVACTRAREMLLVSGAMGLRPSTGTTANNHLVRLARVLGVEIPIGGASDTVAVLPRSGVSCRVRVVVAEEQAIAGPAAPTQPADGVLLPPAGQGTPTETAPSAVPERLSYTQLSEFQQCPKRFWVRRVLGVRAEAVCDAGAADPLRFGTALHTALRLVGGNGERPPDERVETIARFHQLGPDDTARLVRAIARYCASDVARRAAAGAIVRRESPFSMRVGDRFLLTGSIDLYSRTGDSALVVDYKSGEAGDTRELEIGYRLQAECYALAVMRDGCDAVVVEFVRPEVEVPAGCKIERITFEFSASQVEAIERDLLHRYAEIEASAFEPRPSHECLRCDVLRRLCPERMRREVAV